MQLRGLAVVLMLSLTSTSLVAGAQQAGKIYRIGYLSSGSATGATALSYLREAFQQGLRELEWVEGRNIVIEYRYAEGRIDRLAGLAEELVRLKADVIVATAMHATVAAKNAAGAIPIVMIAVSEPVGTGLIASLAHPGGNVTGLTFTASLETYGKGLELLKETVPTVRRVALLSNPTNPVHALVIKNAKGAAASLGVQLQLLEARGPNEFDGAFAAMAKERVGALLVVSDSLFDLHRARLADLAARNRLPAAYGNRWFAEVGGLMSFGPSLTDQWRRAATYVDKVLKGAKPADLPVEQPTKFELVINAKTAKALGLTIPQSILTRADEIIQ